MKFFSRCFIFVLIILGCTQERISAFSTVKTTIRTNLRRSYKKIKFCYKRNLPVYIKVSKQIISKENKKKQILVETMLMEILGDNLHLHHLNISALIATILISNPLLLLLKKKKNNVFIAVLIVKLLNLLIDTILIPYLIHLLKTLMKF